MNKMLVDKMKMKEMQIRNNMIVADKKINSKELLEQRGNISFPRRDYELAKRFDAHNEAMPSKINDEFLEKVKLKRQSMIQLKAPKVALDFEEDDLEAEMSSLDSDFD